MLSTLFYFILALFLLVCVHEYGHFQVARWCGVKVLRFSFGFGKVLWRWHDKKGTEYVLSLLPLGGYVKMLGESEAAVADNEKHLAFHSKPLPQRVAIIVAGPLFNFIFAFAALWLAAMIGMKTIAPIVATVSPGTVAEQAGFAPQDEIVALNDKKISNWQDFYYAMMSHIGDKDPVQVQVQSRQSHRLRTLSLSMEHWKVDRKAPNPFSTLGIKPYTPPIPPIISEVLSGSPASKVPMQRRDKIIAIDTVPISDFLTLVAYVKAHPGKAVTLDIERNGHREQVHLTLGRQAGAGYIGLKSVEIHWPPGVLRSQKRAPLLAMQDAFLQTVSFIKTNFTLIGRLVTGKLGLDSLSGPVGIAVGAGQSAAGGFVYYLMFLAILSIGLGVLNLLPIPLLDGGHLLYFFLEWIWRRPLSESFKFAGLYVGAAIMMGLIVLALMNDLMWLIS